MNGKQNIMKRMLALALCLCLLLGGAVSLAQEATPNVTDTEGPRVSDFVFKEKGKTLKPGDTLHVSAKIRDRSGINFTEVYFSNSNGDGIWINMYYDAAQDRFTGERELTATDYNGTYRITDIYSFDNYGNQKGLYTNETAAPFGKFKLKGAATAPDSKKAKMKVKVKENGKTVKPLDTVHVEVQLQSKYSEEVGIRVDFVYEVSEDESWTKSCWCWYDESSKKYTGSFSFADRDSSGSVNYNNFPNGTYELRKGTVFSPEDGREIATATLSGQSVTLSKSKGGDNDPPTISSGKITEKGKTLKPGDTIHVKAKVKDKAGVREVTAYLFQTGTTWSWDQKKKIGNGNYKNSIWMELSYNSSSGYWEGEYVLPDSTVNGTYYLEINAGDTYYNWNWKTFQKQKIKFKGPDIITWGIEQFLDTVYNGILYRNATESEKSSLGMKLADGSATAVEIVRDTARSSGLAHDELVKRLYALMKEAEPTAAELADWTAQLDGVKGLETLIDTLADSTPFRTLCNDCDVLMGTFGRRKDGAEPGTTAVKKIKLNKKKATLTVNKTVTLKAKVSPSTATNTEVVWSSSDTSVATVSKKGKVTAVGAGECIIRCTAKDGAGAMAECTITVKAAGTNASRITLNKKKITLKVGKSKTLKPEIVTGDGSEPKVKWSSSDKKVAKVNKKGKVTAVGAGECIITCELEDGSAKIEIKVKVK